MWTNEIGKHVVRVRRVETGFCAGGSVPVASPALRDGAGVRGPGSIHLQSVNSSCFPVQAFVVI